jgi:diguanylate cyclase
METLAYIVPWVFTSVTIGVATGYMLGRGRGKTSDRELSERERQATLKTLLDIFRSVERMSGDVESHSSEIQQTADHVGAMHASGEMELVKQARLGHMMTVLRSNRALQEDLFYSRYKIEEQAEQIDHVRREARTDALTTVANRKGFDEKIRLLWAGWDRERHPFVLMMIDVDHLKRINDAHGHQAGDQVLEKLGQWLQQWVREGDFVGRYGGDEFAVLLPRTELAAGRQRAEVICARTAERASRITFRGELVSLSLSVGVTAPADGDVLESLIRRADEALYHAKRAGRNRVQVQEAVASPSSDDSESRPTTPSDDLQDRPTAGPVLAGADPSVQDLDTPSLCG